MDVPVINQDYIDRVAKWKPDYKGIEAVLNSPNNPHPVFASSYDGRHVLNNYKKELTILTDALLYCVPDYLRGAQGIGDCLHPESVVLGPDSTKSIKEIIPGDRVYDGDGQITNVISVTKKTSHKPMVTINTYGGVPLRVTADHRVLVRRTGWYGSEPNRKIISKTFYERKKKQGINNTVVKTFESSKTEWMCAANIQEGDYLVTPTFLDTERKFVSFLNDTNDARWVLGYFCGNGHASGGSVEFTFPNTQSGEKHVSFVIDYFESEGWNPKRDEYKNCEAIRVRIHDTKLVNNIRKSFYNNDGCKLFPSWGVYDDCFVSGLLSADGFVRDNKQVFDSTSTSLAYGVFNYFINKGYSPTIRKSNDKNRYDNAKDIYRVSCIKNRKSSRIWRDESYIHYPVSKILVEEGPHEVYDIGVASHLHSFIANGHVVHNCVSWGAAHAVEMLIAKYAYKRRRKSIFLEVATEPIYGGCRVEALGRSNGGWSDGAYGAAAADWVNKWGIILRKDYSSETGNSSHDYTTYSSSKAKQEGYYGAGGQGDQGKIDEIAKQRPVRTISQVHSFEDCAAVIAGSKCPVTIASTAGFGNMRRDSNGFCRWSGTWNHQMCLVGVRFDIPGCLVAQSWGPRSCSGPKYPNNLPDNIAGYTFWASAADIDRICRSGDCWAFSDLDGWKIERANWDKIFGKIKI